jgi:hypothetical protein
LQLYEVASGQLLFSLPEGATAMAFAPGERELAAADPQSLSVLRWSLRELAVQYPVPGRRSLTDLWADLASSDARRAHRGAWDLGEEPGLADFISRHLHAAKREPPAALARHLRDLGSDDFATREKAQTALADLDPSFHNHLRNALAKEKDLEVRQRIQRLLPKAGTLDPASLRAHRAVYALEMQASPKARQLLQRLADGAPGAWLTDEAKAALARLR